MSLTFPRHVHQRGGVYRIVQDEPEWAAALSDGWVEYPPLDWPRPDVYREWTGEALPSPPRPRGRPKKE